MVTVAELRLHPIKSLRGLRVEVARVDSLGLCNDRRWLLVDPHGEFLTQREFSALALFRQHLSESGITITGPDGGTIEVPAEPTGDPIEVRVWSTSCAARLYEPWVHEWFSQHLGRAARLVKLAAGASRPVPRMPGAAIAFMDASPILVAGAASMRDLNERIGGEPLAIERFRPNVVLEGSAPFEEDDWSELIVGDVRLRPVHRCGRCLVTTIDPDTAESGKEPLATLATYRKFGNNVCFGMYYAPVSEGEIRVGQACRVSTA